MPTPSLHGRTCRRVGANYLRMAAESKAQIPRVIEKLRFLRFFPQTEIHQREVDEFNRQADFDLESIRDFIILHYKVTERGTRSSGATAGR